MVQRFQKMMGERLHTTDDFGYPTQPDSQRRVRNISVRTSKRALLAAIYVLMSIIGAGLWLGRLGRRRPPPLTSHSTNASKEASSGEGKRILVIRLDLIGDLVLSMTVVRALKRAYPQAEIDLLATPASAQVMLHDPDLSEVIAYDPNIWRRPQALLHPRNWRDALALRRRLRARDYDLAISVFGPWAAILSVVSGAPRRIGFGHEGYPGFMTDNVPGRHWSPGDHKHEVDYCLELVRAAGVQTTAADRIPKIFVDPRARQEVMQILQQEGIELVGHAEGGPYLIACHVSSNNGQSKRWPIPYWATLIDRLIREDGARVVLTGAPADLPLIEKIQKRMRERPINLAGKTSLPQLAALLQRADLLISGDSGPMHIASAVGTPLIAIHGPTDPALSGPVGPHATILRSSIWCSPCYNAKDPADCRFFTTQCMKDITPTYLYNVVREKLEQKAGTRSVHEG